MQSIVYQDNFEDAKG